jgi:hypothetical protein
MIFDGPDSFHPHGVTEFQWRSCSVAVADELENVLAMQSPLLAGEQHAAEAAIWIDLQMIALMVLTGGGTSGATSDDDAIAGTPGFFELGDHEWHGVEAT